MTTKRLPASGDDPSGSRHMERIAQAEMRRLMNEYITALVQAYKDGKPLESAGQKEEAALMKSVARWTDKADAQGLKKSTQILHNVGIDIELGPQGLDPGTLDHLRSIVQQDVLSLTADTRVAVGRVIANGYDQGLGVRDIARQVMAETDMSRSRAAMIAQTTIMKTINAEAQDRYARAGAVGMYIMPASDDRVCPRCLAAAYVGNTDQLQFYRSVSLPIHPRCRCTVIPAMSEDEVYRMPRVL